MRGVGADDRDGSRSVEEEGFVGARVGREADAYKGLVRGDVVDELGVSKIVCSHMQLRHLILLR